MENFAIPARIDAVLLGTRLGDFKTSGNMAAIVLVETMGDQTFLCFTLLNTYGDTNSDDINYESQR